MVRVRAVVLALASLAAVAGAQVPEDLLARLKDPIEGERAAALVALGKLKTPDTALLDVIAASLLDEAEGVRMAAAYSLPGVAGKLGCKLDVLDDCKVLKRVLDATPKAVKRVPPRYSDEAKRSRIQGAVSLEFLVRADGSVDRIRVLDGPPLLRDAAVEALRQWRYEPAKRNGKAVPLAMLLTITFRLS